MHTDAIHKLLSGDVNSQIDYFKSSTFDHHAYQIFPNIVKISFDGPYDYFCCLRTRTI